jgi:hypothetical protein
VSGNGNRIKHRLARAAVLAEERLADMIPATDFRAFLFALQAELAAIVPRGAQGQIGGALKRAAAVVENGER